MTKLAFGIAAAGLLVLAYIATLHPHTPAPSPAPSDAPVRVTGEPAWTHTCLTGDEPSCP